MLNLNSRLARLEAVTPTPVEFPVFIMPEGLDYSGTEFAAPAPGAMARFVLPAS